MSDTEWVLVPRDPVEAQWGDLARDIVMWWSFSPPSGEVLYRHLERLGREIPEWLPIMIADRPLVPSKGTVAAVIYRAMLDAAPAAPQQAGQLDYLAGRGMHELRFDELTLYVMSLLAGKGQDTPDVRIALDWIVSELKRKTNDERALAVKLDAIRVAPQQTEPVGVFECDHDMWIHVADEHAGRAGVVPLYLHPPAAEVQRLRDAALALLNELDAGRHGAHEFNNLRNALKGSE